MGYFQAMNWLDRITLIAITAALGFLAILFTGNMFVQGIVAGSAVMCCYGIYFKQDELLRMAPLLAAFPFIGWPFAYVVSRLTPSTIDGILEQLDFNIGISAYHWTMQHPAVESILAVAYINLGVVGAIAMCVSPRRQEMLRACILAAIIAPVLYIVFPAVGPKWVGTGSARNCIPSMHLTWAILFWRYSSPLMRIPMLAFVLVTIAATLGLGEHYVIDLIAAIPFAAMVTKLSQLPVRMRAANIQ